jgi:hypothetical protein
MKKYLLLICLALPMLGFADTSMGEKLTFMLWKDIQAKHIKKISHYTSKHFQAANPTLILTRSQFLQGIKDLLPVDNYQLLNVQTTQGEDVITVTYLVSTFSVPVDSLPSIQSSKTVLDVWKKVNDKWKLVSEAVFPCLFDVEL